MSMLRSGRYDMRAAATSADNAPLPAHRGNPTNLVLDRLEKRRGLPVHAIAQVGEPLHDRSVVEAQPSARRKTPGGGVGTHDHGHHLSKLNKNDFCRLNRLYRNHN